MLFRSAVINVLVNLFVEVSVGANMLIANYIGQGEREKVRQAVHTSVLIALISGLFLAVAGLVLSRPVLRMLSTPPDVLELAVTYLEIYFMGMPFIMLYNFGSAVLRSKGDSRRPFWFLVVGGVVNVNYRSKDRIVRAINAYFEGLMSDYDEEARLHTGLA